jgi:archaetidylinositol phosphate synthase
MIYASVGTLRGIEETESSPPPLNEFKEAQREQNGFLIAFEKKTLRWMAERMPPWINSDHLTALSFLAMIFAGVSYSLSGDNPKYLYAASAFIIINWFGDSLDGTLARYRNKLRPQYGFYVDHILDTFSTFFLLGGLALSGYMSPMVAGLLLIAYLMLSIQVYLATYTIGKFKMSFAWFGPTELRLLLIVGNFALVSNPEITILGNNILLFDLGSAIGIVIITVILVHSSITNIAFLYKKEKIAN